MKNSELNILNNFKMSLKGSRGTYAVYWNIFDVSSSYRIGHPLWDLGFHEFLDTD